MPNCAVNGPAAPAADRVGWVLGRQGAPLVFNCFPERSKYCIHFSAPVKQCST